MNKTTCILASFALCGCQALAAGAHHPEARPEGGVTGTAAAPTAGSVRTADGRGFGIEKFILREYVRIQMLNLIPDGENCYVAPPYRVSWWGQGFIRRLNGLLLRRLPGGTAASSPDGMSPAPWPAEPRRMVKARAMMAFMNDVDSCCRAAERLAGRLPVGFRATQSFVDGLAALAFFCGEEGTRRSAFFLRLQNCTPDAGGLITSGDLLHALDGLEIRRLYVRAYETPADFEPDREKEHKDGRQ